MHLQNGMPFKSFVSTLMELLEDADGIVRDAARGTVISLFQYALTILQTSWHKLTISGMHQMLLNPT